MVTLYVGSSIFGNIWAVIAVSSAKQLLLQTIKKVVQSPPIIALILAVLCYVLAVQHWIHRACLDRVYEGAKIAMNFAGMCILGMWLRKTHVNQRELWKSTQITVLKLLCGAVLCAIIYNLKLILQIESYLGVMFLLFCLPPAANIVVLETHYQGTGVSAQYILQLLW